jgi:hypothetical protein
MGVMENCPPDVLNSNEYHIANLLFLAAFMLLVLCFILELMRLSYGFTGRYWSLITLMPIVSVCLALSGWPVLDYIACNRSSHKEDARNAQSHSSSQQSHESQQDLPKK